MAKIHNSRAKVYETRVPATEEATDYVESEGDRLIKRLVQKQLDTRLDLKDKQFERVAEFVPLGKYTSGQTTLQQFEDCTKKASHNADLKSCGLSEYDIALLQDHENENIGSMEKYRKIEVSELKKRLQGIYTKIEAREKDLAHNPIQSGGVSRHQQELGLSVKPSSEETKLLQFALSCRPASQDLRPANHPIHHLKEMEQELFGHLELNKKRGKRRNKTQSIANTTDEAPSDLPQPTKCSTATGDKVSSLWDVKCLQKSKTEERVKPCRVYSCKPETLYTIKCNKIVPLPKVSSLLPKVDVRPSDEGSCGGQTFICTNVKDLNVKLLLPDDIQNNRISLEEIKKLPRFADYEPGTPSKVRVK
ncbi:unnamed protein product [Timema podura]|uniref:Uncharacterized protein n=1 Tax=Timema podura TaxID=61482 RepID=A0ABN7NCR0_TIMPD|nr:unnamed protein product [Timema podura]